MSEIPEIEVFENVKDLPISDSSIFIIEFTGNICRFGHSKFPRERVRVIIQALPLEEMRIAILEATHGEGIRFRAVLDEKLSSRKLKASCYSIEFDRLVAEIASFTAETTEFLATGDPKTCDMLEVVTSALNDIASVGFTQPNLEQFMRSRAIQGLADAHEIANSPKYSEVK